MEKGMKAGYKSSYSYISSRLLDIYELAKQGKKNTEICKLVGVSWPTFTKRWLTKKCVVDALTRGRKLPDEGVNSFKDYVYKHLSPDLQGLWSEIMMCEKGGTPLSRLEAKIKSKGTLGRQHLLIHALIHSNFNLSKALRLTNTPKSTLELWVQKDDNFAKILDEIDWHKRNFFEGALTALVKKGHAPAILFVNKTLNANRGYGDKITKNVNVNVKGGITNKSVIKIDDLDLDITQRRAILDKIRERKGGEE